MSSKLDHRPILMKYEILTLYSQIGEGGYGKVFAAKLPDGRRVAYKKIDVCLRTIAEVKAKELLNEAAIHYSLDNGNIVKMLGLVYEPSQSGNFGLVLEFMGKGDMHKYIQTNYVIYKKKLGLLRDVASGMSYLHRQSPPIIHGDLKISNVLITDNGRAKISDFGFSRLKEYSKSKSVNGVRVGTVTHIPPEIWKDAHHRKNEACDVYAFAVLMWETFVQEVPFKQANGNPAMISVWVQDGQRPDLSVMSRDVSADMTELIESCWEQDPRRRPDFPGIEGKISAELNEFITQAVQDGQRFHGNVSTGMEESRLIGKFCNPKVWIHDKIRKTLRNRNEYV